MAAEENKERQKSYLEKLAEKLIEWDKKIDEFKAKAYDSTSGAKSDYTRMADELRKKRKKAEEKFDELKTAGGESWDEIKKGAEGALDELSQALNSAIGKFKKKDE